MSSDRPAQHTHTSLHSLFVIVCLSLYSRKGVGIMALLLEHSDLIVRFVLVIILLYKKIIINFFK